MQTKEEMYELIKDGVTKDIQNMDFKKRLKIRQRRNIICVTISYLIGFIGILLWIAFLNSNIIEPTINNFILPATGYAIIALIVSKLIVRIKIKIEHNKDEIDDLIKKAIDNSKESYKKDISDLEKQCLDIQNLITIKKEEYALVKEL